MSFRIRQHVEVGILGWDGLGHEERQLLIHADAVRCHASAPYSHYKVGAAIFWRSGNISVGCNVENCTYNVLHAEKGAIGNGISAWGVDRIERVAVVGAPENQRTMGEILYGGETSFKEVAGGMRFEEACVSCGQCLQDILEFSYGENVTLLLPVRGVVLKTSLFDLLPARFGPHDFGIDYNAL